MDARRLFADTLDWLLEDYGRWRFFTGRDVVWSLQTRLLGEIERRGLGWSVAHDHGVLPGPARRFPSDLAVFDEAGGVALTVELRYEPSAVRRDLRAERLPLVEWSDVLGDLARAERIRRGGHARDAFALLLDEGGRFRDRVAPSGATWEDLRGDPSLGPLSLLRSGGATFRRRGP
jgi:hypothetical protein